MKIPVLASGSLPELNAILGAAGAAVAAAPSTASTAPSPAILHMHLPNIESPCLERLVGGNYGGSWEYDRANVTEGLTHDDFAERVGETFSLAAPDGATLELTLAEANLSPEENAVPGGRAPFELILDGPESPYAPQGTWRVAHDDLGEFEVFLVPLGPEGGAMRYQAVFS